MIIKPNASAACALLLLLCLTCAGAEPIDSGRAGNWPQWRGPNRDNISTDTGLLKEWLRDESPVNQSHNLIQCSDHKWAPWSIVCIHLVNGSTDWNPVPNNDSPEVDYDWLCNECRSKLPDLEADGLKAICIHCVRLLQIRAGVDPGSFDNGPSNLGSENDG